MKTEVIRLRVTPELKETANQLAQAENRTLSNYLENLIITDAKRKEENHGRET